MFPNNRVTYRLWWGGAMRECRTFEQKDNNTTIGWLWFGARKWQKSVEEANGWDETKLEIVID